jgi:hypothetical protein
MYNTYGAQLTSS